MKIQKLVYLAHGHALVERPQPLLNENFEAWKFGPVLPSLYHECKKYGPFGITKYLDDVDLATGQATPAALPTDDMTNDIVEFVWGAYGHYPATVLSEWTHAKGGPWDQVTNSGANIIRNQDIPNDLIKIYFEENLYDDGADLFEKASA